MADEIAFLINIFYLIYDLVRQGIEYILSLTLYEARPEYAEKYADAISMLVPATAIWLILEFTEGLKKVVKYVVVLGWALVALSIIISFF